MPSGGNSEHRYKSKNMPEQVEESKGACSGSREGFVRRSSEM